MSGDGAEKASTPHADGGGPPPGGDGEGLGDGRVGLGEGDGDRGGGRREGVGRGDVDRSPPGEEWRVPSGLDGDRPPGEPGVRGDPGAPGSAV